MQNSNWFPLIADLRSLGPNNVNNGKYIIYTTCFSAPTGATGPKTRAAPSQGDRDLPGSAGAVCAVLWWADPAVHHQLRGTRTAAPQGQGWAEDDTARLPDPLRIQHSLRNQKGSTGWAGYYSSFLKEFLPDTLLQLYSRCHYSPSSNLPGHI